jgi:hypothetical protein
VQHRTRVPVLPDVAARILRTARRDENGCLISLLTPSQKRPNVKIAGAQVRVTRVVMAVHLGRAIEPWEDVHHEKCRTGRCVEADHLNVITAADHRAHHAEERRQALCPRHGTPYDYLNVNGWNRCRKCEAEASARYRQRHPNKRRPPLTEAQRPRRNERSRDRRKARDQVA